MLSRRDLLILAPIAPLAAVATAPKPPEVTATEDLMREHGILRRVLLVYGESVPKLRAGEKVDETALLQAAQLFKRFGEEYHEMLLEEKHIFPIVRKMKGEAASYPDILEAQHKRGREITAYILSRPSGEPLAHAMETFVRMYEHHAAREDTIVFPAWKKNFSDKQLDAISDEFEDIEKKMFGHDGFEEAEETISKIEKALGLAELSKFTAPAPPAAR
jgi:hemerythrin-like domain-containing protein